MRVQGWSVRFASMRFSARQAPRLPGVRKWWDTVNEVCPGPLSLSAGLRHKLRAAGMGNIVFWNHLDLLTARDWAIKRLSPSGAIAF